MKLRNAVPSTVCSACTRVQAKAFVEWWIETIFLGTLLARLEHLRLVSSKLEFFGLGQLLVSEVSACSDSMRRGKVQFH
jgi:hypothetical protein